MHTDAFKRIVTTFADPQTQILIDRDRTVVQVNGNLIEVTLRQKSGEIYVIDAGNELPANQWIITRLAQLPLLADRLLATVPVTKPFVTPEAHLLESLEVKPGADPEHVPEALTATLGALDQRSPLETTVLYITSDAGEGKTCLINEMARVQANRFKTRESDWLLLPIPLGGRTFLRFDDITVGALQNRYRFPYLYYAAFLELVRLGVLVPAFDGFEEMFVETSTGEALSAMGILVGSLQSAGALVIAARKAYFEFQNLKLQARLYDTISGYSVGFAKLSLDRWKKDQFINYCGQRGVPSPSLLYDKVVSRLDSQHPLLTRPVLVRRLVDIAEGSTSLDEFLTVLQRSGGDFFSVFVRGIVEREAHDKWIERGEVAQPLLSMDEHCDLLSLVALEMWHARVDFLKTDSLEFVSDYFSDAKHKGAGAAAQIRERVKGHALLIASPNVHGAVEFDHDEFKQFFLGEAIARLCLSSQTSARADILNALRRGILPIQAFTSLVQMIKRETPTRQRHVAATIAEIAALDGQTSFTHENCAALIVALLSGGEDGDIGISRISFPPNSLRDAKLMSVTFEDCFFAPTSLENTSLRNCRFVHCQFSRLEHFQSTSVQNVSLIDSPVDALCDMHRGINYFEPTTVQSHIRQLGFSLPEASAELPLETPMVVEREDALIQFEKLLRYFMRSTHISESVVRVKLGGRGNAFISEVIPVLIECGILSEMEHRGGDTQRRFKLGRPMEAISRALANSDGTLKQFVALARLAPANR